MADIELKLTGFDALAKQLKELPEKVARKVLDRSLKEAAKPMLATARNLAPVYRGQATTQVNPGLVKRSIKLTSMKVRGGSRLNRGVRIRVAVLKGKKRRGAKATLSALNRGGASFGVGYFDPYYWYFLERGTARMQARPFLLPAFNAHKNQFLNDLKRTLGRRIEEEWKKP